MVELTDEVVLPFHVACEGWHGPVFLQECNGRGELDNPREVG